MSSVPAAAPPDFSQAPAIIQAARAGHLHTLRRLAKAGADLNATDEKGGTALMHAIWQGHTGCVKFLLGAGADVNIAEYDGDTALIYANTGDPAPNLVRLLLKHGADVHATNDRNHDALFYAALELEVRFPVWQSLAQAVFVGCFFGLIAGNGLLLAGHWLAFFKLIVVLACIFALWARFLEWRYDHAAATTVRALIGAGAHSGDVLLNAVQENKTRVVRRLIAAGADIHATNESGETALQLAKKAGHADISRMLERAGARS